MKAFSTFRIPDEEKILYQERLIQANIDYERFSYEDKNDIQEDFGELIKMGLDRDNSNIGYKNEGLVHRINSPRGIGYQYIVSIEGVGPVPMFYLELYTKGNRLGESWGRIDFYGAFYHFRKFLENEFLEKIYEECRKKTCIKRTRIDIALDFDMEYPENAEEYFYQPSNSKRGVRGFHDNGGKLNSVSYLPQRNKGYGVRIYNKTFDTKKKGKEAWYPSEWQKSEKTRIEFEFYPPYSDTYTSEQLIEWIVTKTIQGKTPKLGMTYEHVGFTAENAYEWTKRYCKNHGVPIELFLLEVTRIHKEVSRQKIRRKERGEGNRYADRSC